VIPHHAKMGELVLISMEDSFTNAPALLDMKELTVKLKFCHVNQTHAKMVERVLIHATKTCVQMLHTLVLAMRVIMELTVKTISHAAVTWTNVSQS